MKNILKNINLKQTIKEHIIDHGGQVIQSENWIDLEYTHTGNTYNQNAPIVIQVKVIEAQNPDQTTAFITFHHGATMRATHTSYKANQFMIHLYRYTAGNKGELFTTGTQGKQHTPQTTRANSGQLTQ